MKYTGQNFVIGLRSCNPPTATAIHTKFKLDVYSVKPALIKYKTPTIASCALTLDTFFSILIYFIGLEQVNDFKAKKATLYQYNSFD
jgi:hypothetical protein